MIQQKEKKFYQLHNATLSLAMLGLAVRMRAPLLHCAAHSFCFYCITAPLIQPLNAVIYLLHNKNTMPKTTAIAMRINGG